MAFEIRWAVQSEARLRDGEFIGAQEISDLVALPDVVATFLAVGIGIERAPEGAARRGHLAADPAGACIRGAPNAGSSSSAAAPGIERQQLRVVVQHLFEMRNLPAFIDAVAEKTAAEMIAESSLGHARKREARHASRGICIVRAA